MSTNNNTPAPDYPIRLAIFINLTMMLLMGAFFLLFPIVFTDSWPRFTADAVMLVTVGEAIGLVCAIWSRRTAAGSGPFGRRILSCVYGSFLAAAVLVAIAHTALILFFYNDANPASDLILIRMIPFAPPLAAVLSPIAFWLYERHTEPQQL